jgi:hypothetical protein
MTMDINFTLFLTQGVALVAWVFLAAAFYAAIEKYIPGQSKPDRV